MTLATALIPLAGYAIPIDFENIPGLGLPTEGLAINTQFLATEGVTFSLEGGGSPRIAQVGGPATAFFGPLNNTGADTLAPGQGVGAFFLTDDGAIGPPAIPLLVTYATPTAASSGVILDIDLGEMFTTQAQDASGAILEPLTLRAGDPQTGDGIAPCRKPNLRSRCHGPKSDTCRLCRKVSHS